METTPLEILDTSDPIDNIFVSNAAFENFDKICRFCLGFDNLKPFYDMTFKEVSVQGIIFECSSLQANPDDHLPYNLCVNCIAELIRCYKFKQRCIKASDILQNAYTNRNYIEIKEITTQFNNGECYDTKRDNLVMENKEITPIICNSDVSEDRNTLGDIKIENRSGDVLDPMDECYGLSESKITDVSPDAYFVKTEEIAELFNNSECYGESQDNLIIKNNEIVDEPLMENISGDISNDALTEPSKSAETTTILQGAYENKCYIKTEEPTIQFNDSGCYATSPDNLTIKFERIDDTPMLCYDNISKDIDPLSDNNAENSYKPLQSKTAETAFTRTDSKQSQYGLEANFENDEKGDKYSTCEKTFSKTSALNDTDDRPYKCGICKKFFVHIHNYKEHMLTHPDEIRYRCSVCDKPFFYQSVLKQHMVIHSSERKHKCSVCKEIFARKDQLAQHMFNHTGKKPFECDICEKSFMYKGCLTQHMLIHNGAELYKCSICKKSFTWKHSLEQHMYSHRAKTTPACGICKLTFVCESDLKQHMLIHTGEKPHKCSVCGISYYLKAHLNQHMLIHLGAKPHQCSVCKMSFRHKSNLSSHVRLHTVKKPFVCGVCKQSFTLKKYLVKHILVHSGEES